MTTDAIHRGHANDTNLRDHESNPTADPTAGRSWPLPDQISYRGANGKWYADEREARSKYTFSD
jgi:hypothetical protein